MVRRQMRLIRRCHKIFQLTKLGGFAMVLRRMLVVFGGPTNPPWASLFRRSTICSSSVVAATSKHDRHRANAFGGPR